MPRIKPRNSLAGVFLITFLISTLSAQVSQRRIRYLSHSEAQPILSAMNEVLPNELKDKSSAEVAEIWPKWIANRDDEIRGRLAQGDEDSLVNFLLFGTSYTKRPRITAEDLKRLEVSKITSLRTDSSSSMTNLHARTDDLIRALSLPGKDERLLFARDVLINQKGHSIKTAAGRAKLKNYLLSRMTAVLKEQESYASALAAARSLGDTTEEFAERSTIYRNRGLSSDTSLLPNFALEESLKAILARGLLSGASIRRVAIVGPGLDFIDKQEGYDFYPQQTIQPFAVVDSLFRLGLSRPDALAVTTFDLSPRVNHHLRLAQSRAMAGQKYVVQLPRDPQATWKPEAVAYWERFGSQIGVPAPPVPIPASAGNLQIRAVGIWPKIAARITPVDMNIVLQHLELQPNERFDLIIATNIFVYYDNFEQSLALANVARMLRPGGIMLSNNALLELPFSRVRSVDYTTVVYSDRADDGDHVVWYQRLPD